MRIIVTGIIGQHPGLGGVAWDYGQYVLGLKELGHDVFYLEDSGEWPYNFDGGPNGTDFVARSCRANITFLNAVMDGYGLGDSWAYRFPLDGSWHGMSSSKRKEVLATADLLINVSGSLEHPKTYRAIPRLAYIDSDPVFTQIKVLNGARKRGSPFPITPESLLAERVVGHDVHFSFGETVNDIEPVTPYDWRPTRQPIVLSQWGSIESPRSVFTTVMSWTSYTPVRFGNETFGQKDREFPRFLDMPQRIMPTELEVAMHATQHLDWESVSSANPHPEPVSLTPSELLERRGWRVVDSLEQCGNPESYRRYIEQSMGEWSVAKHGYVAKKPGWFSCRSACYLAAGRPVVTQDTGFTHILPTGEGLFSFNEPDAAVEAINEVVGDYARHSRAAKDIASEYFDSGKVLESLIEQAMSESPTPAPAREGNSKRALSQSK